MVRGRFPVHRVEVMTRDCHTSHVLPLYSPTGIPRSVETLVGHKVILVKIIDLFTFLNVGLEVSHVRGTCKTVWTK